MFSISGGLLSQLDIPYATLLDLDLGRAGGGFGRIKTTIENLIETGAPKAELLKTDRGVLTDAEFAAMHTWQDAEDRKILRGWIDSLKKYGVFFSEPLDLDLAMLAAFPDAYAATIPEGRRARRCRPTRRRKQCSGHRGPGRRSTPDPTRIIPTALFSLSLSLPDPEQAGNASRRADPPQDQASSRRACRRACRSA